MAEKERRGRRGARGGRRAAEAPWRACVGSVPLSVQGALCLTLAGRTLAQGAGRVAKGRSRGREGRWQQLEGSSEALEAGCSWGAAWELLPAPSPRPPGRFLCIQDGAGFCDKGTHGSAHGAPLAWRAGPGGAGRGAHAGEEGAHAGGGLRSLTCYFGPRVCSSRVSAQTSDRAPRSSALSLNPSRRPSVPSSDVCSSARPRSRNPIIPLPAWHAGCPSRRPAPHSNSTASHSLTSEGVDTGRPVGDWHTAEQKIPEACSPRGLRQIRAWEPVPRPRRLPQPGLEVAPLLCSATWRSLTPLPSGEAAGGRLPPRAPRLGTRPPLLPSPSSALTFRGPGSTSGQHRSVQPPATVEGPATAPSSVPATSHTWPPRPRSVSQGTKQLDGNVTLKIDVDANVAKFQGSSTGQTCSLGPRP